jgi:hypothetical protein
LVLEDGLLVGIWEVYPLVTVHSQVVSELSDGGAFVYKATCACDFYKVIRAHRYCSDAEPREVLRGDRKACNLFSVTAIEAPNAEALLCSECLLLDRFELQVYSLQVVVLRVEV